MSKRGRHFIHSFSPFFIVLICLGLINLSTYMRNNATTTSTVTITVTSTPTPIAVTTQVADHTSPTTFIPVIPTIIPTITTAPYTPPTFPPESTIQLLGPPSDSIFPTTTRLSFYWQWPHPLTEDQFFALYLITPNREQLIGTITEPNIGQNYRLHISLEDLTTPNTPYQWQIHLKSMFVAESLIISQQRPFTLTP